jgi:osmotically inducible protein OsmC
VKTLYTAIATAEGGRDGRSRSLDGNLDVRIVPPRELGGPGDGPNPEMLFAAGYAACFQSAMHLVARAQGHDLTDSSVTAEVDLGITEDKTFELAVQLLVSVPELERPDTEKLLEATHQVCPYSRATRGNIPVELIVE